MNTHSDYQTPQALGTVFGYVKALQDLGNSLYVNQLSTTVGTIFGRSSISAGPKSFTSSASTEGPELKYV